jgi:predicted RNase H-like HicB family nuclease
LKTTISAVICQEHASAFRWLLSHRQGSSRIFPVEELAALTIDVKLDDDGRWIGEVTARAGVMAYGATEAEPRQKAAALAFRVIAERVIADRLEHGQPVPDEARGLFVMA